MVVQDGAGLTHVVPADHLGDVDVEHGWGPGVGEVLARRPHRRATGDLFEGLHGGAEAAAAEERPEARADPGGDGQPPPVPLGGRFQAEELHGFHVRGR